MQIIDAHHHFWDLDRNYLPWLRDEPQIPFRYGDYSAIRKNFLPADYQALTGRFEVIGSVYIETEFDPCDPLGEVAWVADVKRDHGLPSVVVAQAWLDREDAAGLLEAYGRDPLVRGIRHKPASAASAPAAQRGAPGSMDDPRWRDGYARLQPNGLSFDLQTPWWHLDAAADLAKDFPETGIIINHTGLPSDRSDDALAGWRAALSSIASAPNVALKISGIGMPNQPWTVEANGPVVLDAIRIFGADRVMFASNFPVDGLTASFETIFGGFDRITADFSDADRAAMFCENARRTYRMEI
ncbi:MAG: amidohydrolase family protein [Paracoccaceae bacterium]